MKEISHPLDYVSNVFNDTNNCYYDCWFFFFNEERRRKFELSRIRSIKKNKCTSIDAYCSTVDELYLPLTVDNKTSSSTHRRISAGFMSRRR